MAQPKHGPEEQAVPEPYPRHMGRHGTARSPTVGTVAVRPANGYMPRPELDGPAGQPTTPRPRIYTVPPLPSNLTLIPHAPLVALSLTLAGSVALAVSHAGRHITRVSHRRRPSAPTPVFSIHLPPLLAPPSHPISSLLSLPLLSLSVNYVSLCYCPVPPPPLVIDYHISVISWLWSCELSHLG